MSRGGPRFVSIPADRLLATLREIGAKVTAKGGTAAEGVAGREVFFEVTPPHLDRPAAAVPYAEATVRVYTSLARGDAEARDCGEDAVRLVVGARVDDRFRPLADGQKILRTAPKDAEDRVGVFLDRLREAIRAAYKTAATSPACPLCHAQMGLRTTRDKVREFYGCVRYPACRGTRSTGEGRAA